LEAFVIENVKGIADKRKGAEKPALDQILQMLSAELGEPSRY